MSEWREMLEGTNKNALISKIANLQPRHARGPEENVAKWARGPSGAVEIDSGRVSSHLSGLGREEVVVEESVCA